VKRLSVFFGVLCLMACSNRSAIPKDIIPVDSMRKIYMDLLMADAYSEQYISKDTTKHDKVKANQQLLENVFAAHHISLMEFKHSLDFYQSRPDLNKNIFDSLSAYSNAHRTELYTTMPKVLAKPKTAHPE
jgi:hypothetical protein